MNLPFWLLRLLPLFEYICPKCRKEVKQNSHECPHCGERFPLAIRVPPTILKDPKKLEAYVHQYVFPRVSEFERNYLTKYFTVLFSDGFESNDFTAWTGTDIQAGYTLVVSNTVKHHGLYSAKYVFASGAWPRRVLCYKTLAIPNPAYARLYLYIASEAVTDGDGNGIMAFRTGAGYYAHLLVKKSGASLVLGVKYYDDDAAGYVSVYSATTLSLTTQTCLEMELAQGNPGGIHVWKDGVAVNDLTVSVHNDGVALVDFAAGSNGNMITGVTNTMTYYIDCVVVADARIYCEGAEAKLILLGHKPHTLWGSVHPKLRQR